MVCTHHSSVDKLDLLILYPIPKDTAKFDRAYRKEHLPYAGPRLVGATGVKTQRVVGPGFASPPYHLIVVPLSLIGRSRGCALDIGSAVGVSSAQSDASTASWLA